MATNAGLQYKYYFSSPVTITIMATSLQLVAPFTGVMRIALLYSSRRPLLAATNPNDAEQLYDANVGELCRTLLHLPFLTTSMCHLP